MGRGVDDQLFNQPAIGAGPPPCVDRAGAVLLDLDEEVLGVDRADRAIGTLVALVGDEGVADHAQRPSVGRAAAIASVRSHLRASVTGVDTCAGVRRTTGIATRVLGGLSAACDRDEAEGRNRESGQKCH